MIPRVGAASQLAASAVAAVAVGTLQQAWPEGPLQTSLAGEQVEELRLQNRQLKAKITSLEEQLKKEEEKHEVIVKSLEQKAMLDKESLMKEMEQRVEALATETHRRMNETTQQVIQENVALRAQLGRLNNYNRDLLKDNEQLQAVMSDLKIQVDLLEDREKEMAKRMVCNRKVISMLTALCEMLQGLGDETEWKKVQSQLEQLKEAAAALRCEEDSRATVGKMMPEEQHQRRASREMGRVWSRESILSKGRGSSRDLRERPSEKMGKSQHWAKLRNRLMMQELSESPAAGLLLALKESKTCELNAPKRSSSQLHPVLPPRVFPGMSNKTPFRMQLLVSHLMPILRGSSHLHRLPLLEPPMPLPQPEGDVPANDDFSLQDGQEDAQSSSLDQLSNQ
ncbi:cilia- and flagella-associated protein 157 [Rhea pennata]|uniref:cilia- and flagella-associated protein 157 n=1 Tax=Rhea pennata TaxID=8795 RepID=UPI002E2535CE